MSYSRPATRLGLGAALLALALGGGVPPASAVTLADPAPVMTEAAATTEVHAFLSAHPRPAAPAADATPKAWAAFAVAEEALLREFPFEAGLAQWGCTIVDSAEPDAEASGGRIGIGGWHVVNCGGAELPTAQQVTSARPVAWWERSTAATAGEHEACSVILEGRHCFTFWGELIQVGYTWLNPDAQIGGRLVLGRSTAPSGECDAGIPVETSPVRFLNPGDAIVMFGRTADWENWSNTFREADRNGTDLGVRSVYCEIQPSAG